jgi:hypothetical protein
MSTLAALPGIRILSLALNLPGPAALMRCRRMGATCVKLEPPSGDPMGHYNPAAYAQLHEGVKIVTADLKTDEGRGALHKELDKTDVLLTSFRPSALAKLGLSWKDLHSRHPMLCEVAIVGALGKGAEDPGHDLTYLAQNDLICGLDLPATLYADMGGSLMASEAVLQAALHLNARYSGEGETPRGIFIEVALSDSAAWLGFDETFRVRRRRACRLSRVRVQGRTRRGRGAGAAFRRGALRASRCRANGPERHVAAVDARGSGGFLCGANLRGIGSHRDTTRHSLARDTRRLSRSILLSMELGRAPRQPSGP